jgi:sterol desaturase/sphingolipid hydroxylase (fatty acid hydroxylase superfamily)
MSVNVSGSEVVSGLVAGVVDPSIPAGPTVSVLLHAIPVFLLLVLLDTLYSHFVARDSHYPLGDTLNSLACSTTSRVFGVYTMALAVVPYDWVHRHWRLASIDATASVWTAAAIFLLIDLGYYLGHRFAHGNVLAWSGHITHHSSEEYNLSTALRQGAFEAMFSAVFFLPTALFFDYKFYRFFFDINLIWQFCTVPRPARGQLSPDCSAVAHTLLTCTVVYCLVVWCVVWCCVADRGAHEARA